MTGVGKLKKQPSSFLDLLACVRLDGIVSGSSHPRSGPFLIRYSTFLNHLRKISIQCGLQISPGGCSQGGATAGHIVWRLTSECFAAIVTASNASRGETDTAYGPPKLDDLVSITAVYFEFNHDKPVPCPELAMDLSMGKYSPLLQHVDNLLTIYAVPGDKIDRARAYLCLQALEQDLSMLTQTMRIDLASNPDALNAFKLGPNQKHNVSSMRELVNRSLVGHFVGRTGGRLARLTYLVTTAQAVVNKSSVGLLKRDHTHLESKSYTQTTNIGFGSPNGLIGGFLARVGLCPRLSCIEDTTTVPQCTVQRLPFIPLVTLQKDAFGLSVPHFAQPDEIKCISIEAEFVLHLDPPIPMTTDAIEKLETITGLTNTEILDQKEQDIVLLILHQHGQEHLYTINTHLQIPNLTQHSYLIKSNLKGYVVKSIPFTCSNQIGEIISILRQQASALAFYETFIIHPSTPVEKDHSLTFHFDLNLLDNHIIDLEFDHPNEFSKRVSIALQIQPFGVRCIGIGNNNGDNNYVAAQSTAKNSGIGESNLKLRLNSFGSSKQFSSITGDNNNANTSCTDRLSINTDTDDSERTGRTVNKIDSKINDFYSQLQINFSSILTQTHTLPIGLVWLLMQLKCPIHTRLENRNLTLIPYNDHDGRTTGSQKSSVIVKQSTELHKLTSKSQLISLNTMLSRVKQAIRITTDVTHTGGILSGGDHVNLFNFESCDNSSMGPVTTNTTALTNSIITSQQSTNNNSSGELTKLSVVLPPGVMATLPPSFVNPETYSGDPSKTLFHSNRSSNPQIKFRDNLHHLTNPFSIHSSASSSTITTTTTSTAITSMTTTVTTTTTTTCTTTMVSNSANTTRGLRLDDLLVDNTFHTRGSHLSSTDKNLYNPTDNYFDPHDRSCFTPLHNCSPPVNVPNLNLTQKYYAANSISTGLYTTGQSATTSGHMNKAQMQMTDATRASTSVSIGASMLVNLLNEDSVPNSCITSLSEHRSYVSPNATMQSVLTASGPGSHSRNFNLPHSSVQSPDNSIQFNCAMVSGKTAHYNSAIPNQTINSAQQNSGRHVKSKSCVGEHNTKSQSGTSSYRPVKNAGLKASDQLAVNKKPRKRRRGAAESNYQYLTNTVTSTKTTTTTCGVGSHGNAAGLYTNSKYQKIDSKLIPGTNLISPPTATLITTTTTIASSSLANSTMAALPSATISTPNIAIYQRANFNSILNSNPASATTMSQLSAANYTNQMAHVNTNTASSGINNSFMTKSVYDFDDTASGAFDIPTVSTTNSLSFSSGSSITSPRPYVSTTTCVLSSTVSSTLSSSMSSSSVSCTNSNSNSGNNVINSSIVSNVSVAPERTIERKTSLKLTIKTVSSQPITSTPKQPTSSTTNTFDSSKLSNKVHSTKSNSVTSTPGSSSSTANISGTKSHLNQPIKRRKKRSIDGKPSAYMLQMLQHTSSTQASVVTSSSISSTPSSTLKSVVPLNVKAAKTGNKLASHGHGLVKKERKRRVTTNITTPPRGVTREANQFVQNPTSNLPTTSCTITNSGSAEFDDSMLAQKSVKLNQFTCSKALTTDESVNKENATSTYGYYTTTYTSVSPNTLSTNKKKISTTYRSSNNMVIANVTTADTTVTTTNTATSGSSSTSTGNSGCSTPLVSSSNNTSNTGANNAIINPVTSSYVLDEAPLSLKRSYSSCTPSSAINTNSSDHNSIVTTAANVIAASTGIMGGNTSDTFLNDQKRKRLQDISLVTPVSDSLPTTSLQVSNNTNPRSKPSRLTSTAPSVSLMRSASSGGASNNPPARSNSLTMNSVPTTGNSSSGLIKGYKIPKKKTFSTSSNLPTYNISTSTATVTPTVASNVITTTATLVVTTSNSSNSFVCNTITTSSNRDAADDNSNKPISQIIRETTIGDSLSNPVSDVNCLSDSIIQLSDSQPQQQQSSPSVTPTLSSLAIMTLSSASGSTPTNTTFQQPVRKPSVKSISDIVDKLRAKSTSSTITTMSAPTGVGCANFVSSSTSASDSSSVVQLGRTSAMDSTSVPNLVAEKQDEHTDQWRDNIFEKFCPSSTPNSAQLESCTTTPIATSSTSNSVRTYSDPNPVFNMDLANNDEVTKQHQMPEPDNNNQCKTDQYYSPKKHITSQSAVGSTNSDSYAPNSEEQTQDKASKSSFEMIKAVTDTPASPTDQLFVPSSSITSQPSKIIPISPTSAKRLSSEDFHSGSGTKKQNMQKRHSSSGTGYDKKCNSGRFSRPNSGFSRGNNPDNYMHLNSAGHAHPGMLHRRGLNNDNLHHNKQSNYKSIPNWTPVNVDYAGNPIPMDSSLGLSNPNSVVGGWMMPPSGPGGCAMIQSASVSPGSGIMAPGGSTNSTYSSSHPQHHHSYHPGSVRPMRPNFGTTNNSAGMYARRHDNR